jgi:hypothetical protein
VPPDPAINDFIATNAHPNFSAVREIFCIPGVASPIRSEKVCPSARNLDQQPSVRVSILAEMALRIPKYVAHLVFINREGRHSEANGSLSSP